MNLDLVRVDAAERDRLVSLQDLHRKVQPDDDCTAVFLTRLHAQA